MPRVPMSLFLLTSATFLIACDPEPGLLEYMPDDVFEAETEYHGPLETLGQLTQGYVTNTTALRQANNKIRTLCIAGGRCENEEAE